MIDYMIEYYFVIMVVAGFIIFALIGYIVDSVKNKKQIQANNIDDNADIKEPVSIPTEVEAKAVEEVSAPINNIVPEAEPAVFPETSPQLADLTSKEEFVLTDEKKENVITEKKQ